MNDGGIRIGRHAVGEPCQQRVHVRKVAGARAVPLFAPASNLARTVAFRSAVVLQANARRIDAVQVASVRIKLLGHKGANLRAQLQRVCGSTQDSPPSSAMT
jgi:hypothetical protein